ncbi:Oxidase ucsJ [Psilocybe cubensis]|uniref:Oxidase ucsJ n=2 Tax=Psilocybe cubensis TaxID=181762 RepID=A0ACB8GXC9_PSICU|nr:Oxidase ucsJ [Psilocybe cubensis]KAH9480249.1 Oxidase ucsJ [Psilocybe cubensis]
MTSQLKIFITGATGYVGGGVLARLLKHKDSETFSITALARSPEKAEKLKTLGVNVILGSYSDADLSFLTNEAARSDVVFAIADSDQLPATQAILKGLKIKFENSGKAPILIHTSGAALLSDDARGMTSDRTIYNDLDAEKINAFPETVFHRNVDIPIVEADKEGYIKSYIIIPGAIYGRPSPNPVVDLGIQNTVSLVQNFMIKPAIARKQGGYFGKGLNYWSYVSVDDTADLFLVLFDSIRRSPENPGHGTEGYYFATCFSLSGIELAGIISEVLFESGYGISKEPSPFTQEEILQIYGSGPLWTFLAANLDAESNRSRALGWNPKGTKAHFFADIREQIKALQADLVQ